MMRRTMFLLAGLLLLWGSVLGVLFSPVSTAAPLDEVTIDVTSTADDLTANGNCTLREAIEAANSKTAVDACPAGGAITTTIMIPSGTYTITIVGSGEEDNQTGDLDVQSNIIFRGAGQEETILDGNQLDRVLDIFPDTTVHIYDLTITNGIDSGGGIYADANLRLENVTVRQNGASNAVGGGIRVGAGSLTMINSKVYENVGLLGGGIASLFATVLIEDSQIYDNTVPDPTGAGAGLYLRNSQSIIRNSLIAGNESGDYGGGVVNVGGEDDASLTITDSEIRQNVAGTNGGGIANTFTTGRTATLVLQRVVVDGNRAAVGDDPLRGLGGGIANAVIVGAASGNGIVHIRDSVISNNQATNGGGIGNTPETATGFVQMQVTVENSAIISNTAGGGAMQTGNGGGILSFDGQLTVVNSTISGNTAAGTAGAMAFSGLGGGIATGTQALPNQTTLVANSIVNNMAATGVSGLFQVSLGGATATQFKNNVVAGNVGLNCFNNGGTLSSFGYNLEGGDGCGFNHPTDVVDTNPLLDGLTEVNHTFVHPLQVSSPALDTGSCTDANDNPLDDDQRRVARPQGVGCDRGAYEYEFAPALALGKQVAVPGGDATAVSLGATITYTLVLSNSGNITATNATVTDSLPAELTFGAWVTQPAGADEVDGVVSWTGDVGVGEAVMIVFTAVHVGDYEDVVVNTAVFSHASGTGQASASFTVEAEPIEPPPPSYTLFLPLITTTEP